MLYLGFRVRWCKISSIHSCLNRCPDSLFVPQCKAVPQNKAVVFAKCGYLTFRFQELCIVKQQLGFCLRSHGPVPDAEGIREQLASNWFASPLFTHSRMAVRNFQRLVPDTICA